MMVGGVLGKVKRYHRRFLKKQSRYELRVLLSHHQGDRASRRVANDMARSQFKLLDQFCKVFCLFIPWITISICYRLIRPVVAAAVSDNMVVFR
jgi:hypothetical protein